MTPQQQSSITGLLTTNTHRLEVNKPWAAPSLLRLVDCECVLLRSHAASSTSAFGRQSDWHLQERLLFDQQCLKNPSIDLNGLPHRWAGSKSARVPTRNGSIDLNMEYNQFLIRMVKLCKIGVYQLWKSPPGVSLFFRCCSKKTDTNVISD